ncbi:histidine kinase [Catenovulum sp. SM1970]|uniref:sensor histidine kinase n=1 Tax=Marinifaba aquimaris TaxID=2741323 RepID=UPI001573D3C8|nr:ATP-binding protein [Marinifaba aquimaris]NTS76655.1 histidine kinase [Marinifaba aquimaris]
MDESDLIKQINLLKRKLAREQGGREHAEQLLESKARELYQLNQKLTDALASLKNHEVQLIQQEKLASIGLLAAGVAHEINTPAGYVVSNLNTLNNYIESIEQCHQTLDNQEQFKRSQYHNLIEEHDLNFILEDMPALISTTLKGMQKITSIVGDLKAYSREGSEEFDYVCVDELLIETLNLTANQLKYHVVVETDFNCPNDFYADATKLSQVFLNLIINAGQAIKEKGRLIIRSKEFAQHIEISFEDDGSGMDKATALKLFDPFFTTKPVGVGTGIGLYICNDIVKKHQGEIKVHSEIGRGSTFIVVLPKCEPQES